MVLRQAKEVDIIITTALIPGQPAPAGDGGAVARTNGQILPRVKSEGFPTQASQKHATSEVLEEKQPKAP